MLLHSAVTNMHRLLSSKLSVIACITVVLFLLIVNGPSQASAIPIGGEQLLNSGIQDVQTAVKEAINVLFNKDNLCDYINSTLSNLIANGRLILSEYESGLMVDHLPSGQIPVSILELLPQSEELSQHLNNELLEFLKLETLKFDCHNRSLNLKTLPYRDLTAIEGVMELRNISLVLNHMENVPSVFVFSGDWVVGDFTLEVELSYNLETDSLEISSYIEQDNLMSFDRLIEELTGNHLPIFSGAIQNIEIIGDVASKVVIIGAQFSIGESKAYLVLQKSNTLHTAVDIEISNVRLSTLIDRVTDIDISRVPYFKSLVLPTSAMIYSTEHINSSIVSTALSECPLLGSDATVLRQGLTAYLQVAEFSGSLLKLVHREDMLDFSISGQSLSVQRILSQIPGVESFINNIDDHLPSGVSDVLDLGIAGMNIQRNKISVEVELPMSLYFSYGALTIMDPRLIIDISYPNTRVDASVKGQLTIADLETNALIAKDDSGQYILCAEYGEIRITNIIRQFGAELLSPELDPLVENLPFIDFGITKLSLKFPVATIPLQVHLSGQPVISGFNPGTITAAIIKYEYKIYMVQGIDLGSYNLAELLGTISPAFESLLSTNPLLSQDCDIAVLISPEDLPDISLSFEDFIIKKGLSIKAVIGFPDSCQLDPFCNVAQSLLGDDTSLTIQGTITNPSSYSLIASVTDLDITFGALTITNVGVYIEVVATTIEIGITGSIELDNPSLVFTCQIGVRLPLPQVTMEMTMSGCWENPFGFPYLAICNLHSSVAIVPGSPPTGLALGGEVRIGDHTCGRVINASCYVGVDPAAPVENYYYAEIEGEVTFPSILQAFCINIDLPGPLADSGFPNGFLSSASLFPKILPHLIIPHGFRFNGTINILGLTASADVNIALPEGLRTRIELPVINVGGLIVMSRSSSSRDQGPILKADIELLPSPNICVEAQGFISVLGISSEAKLKITNTSYEVQLRGNILNLFQADFTLSAPYSPVGIASTPFKVQGSFKNDLINAIQGPILHKLDTIANEASRVTDDLQREVDRARQVFREADNVFRNAQAELNRAQGVFDNAVREVDNLRRRVDSVCHTRSCGSVCVGCFSGSRCCGRSRWTGCYCWTPRWKDCCSRVVDPVCVSANAACEALKAPIVTSLDGAREAVRGSQVILDAAREALQVARHTVRAAEHSVDIAVAALGAARQTYSLGLQAADVIARFAGATGEILDIKEISFMSELSVASGGRFSCTIRARILGQQTTLSIGINLNNIPATVREISDRVVRGLSNTFG